MRESAHEKGRRLLVEGRVRVVECHEDNGVFVGEVRGDSARAYIVSFDSEGWRCDCPTIGRCSHVVACQLICVFSPRRLP